MNIPMISPKYIPDKTKGTKMVRSSKGTHSGKKK